MSEMTRLAQAFSGAGLDDSTEVIARFQRLADLLNTWNASMNLISRKDPYAVIERHFLDSAGLVAVLDLPSGCRVMDLGSGAGFPGLPLALLRPDVQVTLVESRAKKTTFHRAVIDALGLENVVTLAERVEQLPIETGPFDCVVSRAVADLDKLVKWCHHLVRKPGGRMAVIKGPDLDEEIKRLARRATAWGVSGWDVEPYNPFGNIRDRESVLVRVYW